MSSVLRFPNAVSDIGKFIETFRLIYSHLNEKDYFTHDDATEILVNYGLASSSGAIGLEALRRSTRGDRSRDPLYNQHKMYSEVYRMLGWYQPGTQRTNFKFTELSPYIFEGSETIKNNIFLECLIGISFPNSLVENRGGNSIRPFSFLIQLMKSVGGSILRDEIILFVLALENDRNEKCIEKQSEKILSIRNDGFEQLQLNLEKLAINNNTQVNTLQNYTRFVLGALSYTSIAKSVRNSDLYGKSIVTYELTERGYEIANRLNALKDIRHPDIEDFSMQLRGSFVLIMHYTFLERIGLPTENLINSINELEARCADLYNSLKVTDRYHLLFSPIQQANIEEIDTANEIDSQL
jgi:hypothetical protein